jgi:hypothetical protein
VSQPWRSPRPGVRPSQPPRGGIPRPPAAAQARRPLLDPFRISIFALILIALSRLNLHLGLERFRLAFVLAVGAAALAVFRPRTVNLNVFRFWPPRVVVAIGVLACLSALFGISMGALAIRDERDLRFLMWAYVISCGILASYSLFVFDVYGLGRRGIDRLGGLYSYDSNDIGCILMTGLPLAILLFQTSKTPGRIASALTLLGIGATVALSGSRGTFVGLLVVGGALLFLVPGVSSVKRVGFLGVVGLGMVFFAPEGYWAQMATIVNPTQDYNWTDYYGRRKTAERALGYMASYPAFGLGINNFARAEGSLSERALSFEYVRASGVANRWRASHNSFLQAGSELGVPGLVLWCSLLFGGIVGLRRLWRRLGPHWARGDPSRQFIYLSTLYLRVAILGFAATSFFVSFAWLDPLYIMVALVTGIYVCVEGARRAVPQMQGQPVPRMRGQPVPQMQGHSVQPVQRRPMPPIPGHPALPTQPVMHTTGRSAHGGPA